MLGSVHDAEDALQDALLRAWRGISKFEGRISGQTGPAQRTKLIASITSSRYGGQTGSP
jgi:DNA-directed RNA polymerase specialized sigma24 family protein